MKFNHSITAVIKPILALALILGASSSFAQASNTFQMTGLESFVCTLIEWMSGRFAVLVFFVMTVLILIVGMFANMDWTKIIYLVVIFGIIQGVVGGSISLGLVKNPCKGGQIAMASEQLTCSNTSSPQKEQLLNLSSQVQASILLYRPA
jgi:type IV secretory pathway VirB2 component (pilin)